MFILGTICCRGGSKGIPQKNIRLLKGKPLIAYTIKAALASKYLNDVIVSTNNECIASIAKQHGAVVPFIRPAELATDAASKWPVFIHALESYEKQNGKQVDYLVDMDVTVPLKTANDIDGAIQMCLNDNNVEVVITGYEPERNPYFNMMEIGEDGFARIVKQSDMPIVRRQDAPKVWSLTPPAYVIKKSALYNYEHWSKAKCMIYSIPKERAIDVDTETDYQLVEFLMEHNN